MSDNFIVYSKSGCGYCTRLVDFMEQKSIPYTKLMLGDDYSVEEFVSQFGNDATFPRVMYQEDVIGGMKDTVKYLVNNNHV